MSESWKEMQTVNGADADGTGLAPVPDRRHEGELLERSGPGRTEVADLLARFGTGGGAGPGGEPPPGGADGAPAEGGAGWDLEGLAAAIAARTAPFLGGRRIGVDVDFFDAGATSVDAAGFAAALNRDLGLRLSLDDVFADARPRRLARLGLASATGAPHREPADAAADEDESGDEGLDLVAADLARADRLPWTGPAAKAPPRRILLTGATGFLGGHLLLDLLRRGDAHVVCLVRAADARAGERRLGEALAGFRLPWSAEVRRRVTVLPGDIAEPRLGLDGDRWEELAREVDSIVSVAAAVDFLRGYPSLRRANVLGPLTLAELAATGPSKPLHHISSVAVFNEAGIASMGEDDPLARVDRLATGYDRSKWASEVALRRAREHGLTVTLMRPGAIGGHTLTGAHNPTDIGSGLLSAFSRFRKVPAFRAVNAAPVDWVSRVAAAVVYEPDGWGTTYNLTGRPNTLPDVLHDMRLGGMHVPVLGWEEWRAAFLAAMEAGPVPELEFLARVLRNATAVKLVEATLLGPAATGERTEAFVARHGLPEPVRYGARAQLRTYERLAEAGLARLPGRDDPPYLSFHETLEGTLGPAGRVTDTVCSLSLTLSIAGMHQLVRERRVDVRGEMTCARLHPEPLTVESGDIVVRPEDGIPLRHGLRHPLLRYRLAFRDADGRGWWLEGVKTARARRDLWRQARTLAVEVGREGEPSSLTGEVVVPAGGYVREQIDGIEVDPALPPPEQRLAKLMWLGWFFAQVGWGLLEPGLRAGAELLDLRRDVKDRRREIR
ncbi:thioester reductase-like protein [Actinomadura luteofluorescens]|uniref:Thioester reductase-like protein n=1 Tax=Actinomadura luteofluorescens TaxID=46163 RepID=A0A7Y9ENS4_9ACTN|nr:thioester reductase domain-containing protein [Actinomadura luteofluorescens]NYD51180.1 thioester reductase-like protein [Actinomadura luteofluorescens]